MKIALAAGSVSGTNPTKISRSAPSPSTYAAGSTVVVLKLALAGRARSYARGSTATIWISIGRPAAARNARSSPSGANPVPRRTTRSTSLSAGTSTTSTTFSPAGTSTIRVTISSSPSSSTSPTSTAWSSVLPNVASTCSLPLRSRRRLTVSSPTFGGGSPTAISPARFISPVSTVGKAVSEKIAMLPPEPAVSTVCASASAASRSAAVPPARIVSRRSSTTPRSVSRSVSSPGEPAARITVICASSPFASTNSRARSTIRSMAVIPSTASAIRADPSITSTRSARARSRAGQAGSASVATSVANASSCKATSAHRRTICQNVLPWAAPGSLLHRSRLDTVIRRRFGRNR